MEINSKHVTTIILDREDVVKILRESLAKDGGCLEATFVMRGGDDGYGGYTTPDLSQVKIVITKGG